MTLERERAEDETMQVIRGIWAGSHEAFLRAAAISYAKGLRDGAEIMARRTGEPLELSKNTSAVGL
ncbi:MAG: hypothetical protein J6O13_01510 [Selenomonas sp.]|nr:hypothetical protein [Anaerovibrio sp.]MBO6202184.1 hypothetical protein [Selenomonas sp.]